MTLTVCLFAAFFLQACSGPKGRYRGPFAPTTIAYHPIDISRASEFTFRANLQVNKKPFVSDFMPFDSVVGPYMVGIYSQSLSLSTKEGNKLMDSLFAVERSTKPWNNPESSEFRGLIRITWIDPQGTRISHMLKGWGGSPRYNAVIVGSPKDFTWLKYQKNQKDVELYVEVLVPDTSLARILKDPQFWIHTGGGK